MRPDYSHVVRWVNWPHLYHLVMSTPRRLALSSAGVCCVGLAFLGAALPGLPTTPFLLLAAWLFARSNPELGKRLLAHKMFRPYRAFVEGTQPIPLRARIVTIVLVWAAVSLSAWLLHSRDVLPTWLAALLFVAALTGTVVVLRFRR